MVVATGPFEIALWAGAVILVLLIGVGFVTLGESLVRQVTDYRRETVADAIRMAMLERMTAETPEWESWVDGLSAIERDVARSYLEDYLRSTRGTEQERLQDLGHALGIPAEAKRTLREGKRHNQLQALTWLTLLEEPVDIDILRAVCTADSGRRAAGARLLYATDHPDAKIVGTDLLIGDGDVTLSVYGLDTLYLLHRDDPTSLYERGKQAHTRWRPSLVIQVLTVLRHCGIVGRDAPMAWIVALTDHELPAIRAAAALALAPEGWRSDLRGTIDVDALLADTEPTTRRAVYMMLAEWGDDDAHEALARAARTETDQRSRVQALTRLQRAATSAAPRADDIDDPDYKRAWQWVRANEEVVEST